MSRLSPTSQPPVSPPPSDPASPKAKAPKTRDLACEPVTKALADAKLDVWGRASAVALSNCAIRGEWQADGVETLGRKVHEWAWSNRDRLDRTVDFVVARTPFRGSTPQIAGQVIQLLACGWATR